MKTRANSLIAGCGLLLIAASWPTGSLPAQETVVEEAAAQPAESAADMASHTYQTFTLRADTELHLRMLDTVASNTHKRLDRFKLELVEPITFEGRENVPVGSLAEGEVVHSAKAGMAGKAGELILATRFLRVGKNISVPSGTDVYAKVAGDHLLPVPTSPAILSPIPTESQPAKDANRNEDVPQ